MLDTTAQRELAQVYAPLDEQIQWMLRLSETPMMRHVLNSLVRLREMDNLKRDDKMEVFERSACGVLVCVSIRVPDEEITARLEEMFNEKYAIFPGQHDWSKRVTCLHNPDRVHMRVLAGDALREVE
jgi:hypothetical protein